MHSKGLEFILNVSKHTSILLAFTPRIHILTEWFFTHYTWPGYEGEGQIPFQYNFKYSFFLGKNPIFMFKKLI